MTKKKKVSSTEGLSNLREIYPKTQNQERIFQAWDEGKHLVLSGLPGTGKTFVGTYLPLEGIFNGEAKIRKLIYVRSAVATRDVGFLPGSLDEKISVFEFPYHNICAELFMHKSAYEILKEQEKIEFQSTSFIRGMTLENCVVLVDECQNLSYHELRSVITRAGNNCRFIFCGDYAQSDLRREKDDILDFFDILKSMRCFEFIEMGSDDIVRSGLVKEFILAEDVFFSSVYKEQS